MNPASPWYKLYSLMPTPFPYCGESNAHWIHDPVDTWSSLLYLIPSLWMFLKTRDDKSSPLANMYLIPIFISVGSILFHTSFTYVFLMADFFGIFILNFFCLGMNAYRLGINNGKSLVLKSMGLAALWTTTMLGTFYFGLSSGLTMIPPILGTLYLEMRCFKTEQETNYFHFFLGGFLIILGYILMLIEGKPWHIGCFNPILHLHTWWHVFSAISMIFIFNFYLQFCTNLDKN